MELIALCIFLHIIFGSLTRMLQGIMPLHIKLNKIRTLPKVWILPSFSMLRFVFVVLIVYNSFILSLSFVREILIPYLIWYTGIVAWVKPFTHAHFDKAFKVSVVCCMYVMILVFEYPKMFPNAVWSIYIMYISSWYKWCLPI
jgi:hypothetical protein